MIAAARIDFHDAVLRQYPLPLKLVFVAVFLDEIFHDGDGTASVAASEDCLAGNSCQHVSHVIIAIL